MTKVSIAKILIESEAVATDMAATLRRNATGVEIVEARIEESLRHLAPAEGKRVLLVRWFRGKSFKRCQGFKPEYACCNLHTFAEGNHCALECTFCILQYYMTSPHLTIFANTGDIEAEIADGAGDQPERIFRITTGELGDSLLLDPLTEASRRWVLFFRGLKNALLELKTKTDNIENLLRLDAGQRTVVSWSVNPQEIVEREELKTAPIDDRLAAASRVARHGYPVGFHLDPIIHYAGWRAGYTGLLDALLDAVPPERIAWISLGSLRFPLEMKPALATRFPRSTLRCGELVPCDDGKMRYPRPIRAEMFRALVEHLEERFRRCGSAPLIYLCMEPPDMWQRVFGTPGPSTAELDFQFAESYVRRFPHAGLPTPRREAHGP